MGKSHLRPNGPGPRRLAQRAGVFGHRLHFPAATRPRNSTSSWGRANSRGSGDHNFRRQLATALEKFERIESAHHGGQPLTDRLVRPVTGNQTRCNHSFARRHPCAPSYGRGFAGQNRSRQFCHDRSLQLNQGLVCSPGGCASSGPLQPPQRYRNRERSRSRSSGVMLSHFWRHICRRQR